eukprot:CAMPEP_0172592484 /NCGR_PEP_ID=MMETSP1068-20121228/11463_1 /TAXON_ID=35684 /ORGANISM="Pseudopedinella elastica, Strain CCMP716" /LENGTH=66 /DNA_ID=CAMNT_0013389489 /DNA_START=218 /DNA_END=418 /DNA_ORIENTATION=-
MAIKTSVQELQVECERLSKEVVRLDSRCDELTRANSETETSAAAMVQQLGDRMREEVKMMPASMPV